MRGGFFSDGRRGRRNEQGKTNAKERAEREVRISTRRQGDCQDEDEAREKDPGYGQEERIMRRLHVNEREK